jgi:hypothetical protein
MSIITAILEPDDDGALRLPIPLELRGTKVKVEARIEAIQTTPRRAKAGLWKDLPDRVWMSADFDAPLDDFREYME